MHAPYTIVITSIGDTHFQTRPDSEWAIIGQASLLQSWHWVLCSFVSLFMWENAHKCLNKRSWRPLPVFLIPNMFGLRLHLPNIRSCLLSSASKYEVPCQPAKSYLERDLQNRFEFYHQVIISWQKTISNFLSVPHWACIYSALFEMLNLRDWQNKRLPKKCCEFGGLPKKHADWGVSSIALPSTK